MKLMFQNLKGGLLNKATYNFKLVDRFDRYKTIYNGTAVYRERQRDSKLIVRF